MARYKICNVLLLPGEVGSVEVPVLPDLIDLLLRYLKAGGIVTDYYIP